MTGHVGSNGAIPPRDTDSRGLNRIITLAGAYGTRNNTVHSLRAQKGKRVLVETLPFTPEEAIAAEEAGIDTMKVRFDPAQLSGSVLPEASFVLRASDLDASTSRSIGKKTH